MNHSDFVKTVAAYIKKYAPVYGIEVVSPIIAQAVLESGYGTSELAVNAHNYFGLKYRKGRCKTCIGIYHMVGSEQNADGSYTSSAMQWCKFKDMLISRSSVRVPSTSSSRRMGFVYSAQISSSAGQGTPSSSTSVTYH